MIYISSYSKKNGIEKRKQEHQLAYKLLEYGLQKEYGVFPKDYILAKQKWGKPYLISPSNIYFNISHCEGLVVCGILEREIGIDIEKICPFSEKIIKKVLTKNEQEILFSSKKKEETFFRFWTLKESYIKAIGTGLSFPLLQIEFNWNKEEKISCNQSGVLFVQRKWKKDYILSVCVRTKDSTIQTEMEEWIWKKIISLP